MSYLGVDGILSLESFVLIDTSINETKLFFLGIFSLT